MQRGPTHTCMTIKEIVSASVRESRNWQSQTQTPWSSMDWSWRKTYFPSRDTRSVNDEKEKIIEWLDIREEEDEKRQTRPWKIYWRNFWQLQIRIPKSKLTEIQFRNAYWTSIWYFTQSYYVYRLYWSWYQDELLRNWQEKLLWEF